MDRGTAARCPLVAVVDSQFLPVTLLKTMTR
jgi:hypothetical protein